MTKNIEKPNLVHKDIVQGFRNESMNPLKLSVCVFQVLIFGEVPDWRSLMGATMVMVCVVGMGLEDVAHRLFTSLP